MEPAKLLRAVGTMSGTSMDGVDVALIETDGRCMVHAPQGAHLTLDFNQSQRKMLFDAVAMALEVDSAAVRNHPFISQVEAMVTAVHVQALAGFISSLNVTVDVIGFHGQTILHRPNPADPASAFTIQLGDGQALANALKVPVVHDFRTADVEAGGQGAPLAPLYHHALLASSAALPAAILNLGGIANITLVEGTDPEGLLACDIGPANVFMDDVMLARTGRAFDEDGKLAAAGSIDQSLVKAFFDHPFFALKGPKSLDRYSFPVPDVRHLCDQDAMASLAALTVGSVVRALDDLPARPTALFVAGGGARNTNLMKLLAQALPCPVASLDSLGACAAMMEAQAFAYLAVRHRRGLPLSFPNTTGVPMPMLGGKLALPVYRRSG